MSRFRKVKPAVPLLTSGLLYVSSFRYIPKHPHPRSHRTAILQAHTHSSVWLLAQVLRVTLLLEVPSSWFFSYASHGVFNKKSSVTISLLEATEVSFLFPSHTSYLTSLSIQAPANSSPLVVGSAFSSTAASESALVRFVARTTLFVPNLPSIRCACIVEC